MDLKKDWRYRSDSWSSPPPPPLALIVVSDDVLGTASAPDVDVLRVKRKHSLHSDVSYLVIDDGSGPLSMQRSDLESLLLLLFDTTVAPPPPMRMPSRTSFGSGEG